MSGSRSAATRATRPNAPNAQVARPMSRLAAIPTAAAMARATSDDEHVQGQLVVRAEEADDEVLGARRLEVDDQGADREDERWGARDDAGDELRDRHRHAGGDRSREGRGPEPAPSAAHRHHRRRSGGLTPRLSHRLLEGGHSRWVLVGHVVLQAIRD